MSTLLFNTLEQDYQVAMAHSLLRLHTYFAVVRWYEWWLLITSKKQLYNFCTVSNQGKTSGPYPYLYTVYWDFQSLWMNRKPQSAILFSFLLQDASLDTTQLLLYIAIEEILEAQHVQRRGGLRRVESRSRYLICTLGIRDSKIKDS